MTLGGFPLSIICPRSTSSRVDQGRILYKTVLEVTQGQMDGFLSDLLYKCHLEEVASVGYLLAICPQLDSRAEKIKSKLSGDEVY